MLNNWDDPFAKFANNKKEPTDSASDEPAKNVINQQVLENNQPTTTTTAAATVTEQPTSKVEARAQNPRRHMRVMVSFPMNS